jgi:hypothetical protein
MMAYASDPQCVVEAPGQLYYAYNTFHGIPYAPT